MDSFSRSHHDANYSPALWPRRPSSALDGHSQLAPHQTRSAQFSIARRHSSAARGGCACLLSGFVRRLEPSFYRAQHSQDFARCPESQPALGNLSRRRGRKRWRFLKPNSRSGPPAGAFGEKRHAGGAGLHQRSARPAHLSNRPADSSFSAYNSSGCCQACVVGDSRSSETKRLLTTPPTISSGVCSGR